MFPQLFMILIKYLAVSGLLLLMFVWLLKGRVSYSLQRAALLLILPLSIVVATISFDIIGVEKESLLGGVIVEVEQSTIVTTFEELDGYNYDNEYVAMEEEHTAEVVTSLSPSSFSSPTFVSHINWWMVMWSVVAAALLVRFLVGVGFILRLRRLSDVENHCDYSLCRCALVESPFSFLRSVYIDRTIRGEKFDIIVQHEVAHISHHHYFDKLMVEAFVILMWFNPIAWIIRKELCVVHEFEADRSVLKGYSDIKKYKQFLFDELIKPTPYVANGFNNSLIKQRFLEMKNRAYGKNYFMRKGLYLIVVLFVVAIVSLTYVVSDEPSEIISETPIEIAHDAEPTVDVSLYIRFKNGSTTNRAGDELLKEINHYKAELIEYVRCNISGKASGVIPTTDSIDMVLSYIKQGDFDAAPPFAMREVEKATVSEHRTRTLLYDDGHTEVFKGSDIARASAVDSQLLTSSTTDDGEGTVTTLKYGSNKNYVAYEQVKDGELVLATLITRGGSNPVGDQIIVTFKDGKVKGYDSADIDEVKSIPASTIQSIDIRKAPQVGLTHETDADFDKNVAYTPSTTGTAVDDRTPDEKRVQFYDLRRDQITVLNPTDFSHGRTVAYRRKDCTEVDFISPIFYSKQWFGHSSETYIIDPSSGKRYQIRDVAKGVPIDRYVRVINQVGYMVLFTCVFPPLPEGVNTINILEYPPKGQVMPSHSSGDGPWLVKDVLVLDDVEREYRDVMEV